MIMRKVQWHMLSCSEICRIAHLERGIARTIPDLRQLEAQWKKMDCFLFQEGEGIAGFALVDPVCTWIPGSIRIGKLCFSWEYNREDVIWEMICSAVAAYPDREYVCMDVERSRDVNYSLYRRIGFAESPLHSPLGVGHTILTAAIRELSHL